MEEVINDSTHIEKFIFSKDDLVPLKTIRALFMRYTKITFRLKNVDASIQSEWESAINRHYNACGCGEGKFFVFLGFFLFCITLWQQQQLYLSWHNAGLAFLYAMAGAAVGKLYGKYRAFLKLRKKISQILIELK